MKLQFFYMYLLFVDRIYERSGNAVVFHALDRALVIERGEQWLNFVDLFSDKAQVTFFIRSPGE